MLLGKQLEPSEALSQRAKEYCNSLNRQLYSFDLALFAKKELELIETFESCKKAEVDLDAWGDNLDNDL